MGTKNTKPSPRRTVVKDEKLIKVRSEVHQRIKVKAAQSNKKMGDYVDERTQD